MRLYSSLPLAAVVLFAWVNASLTASQSTVEGPISSDQHEPQRFLRQGVKANEEIMKLLGIKKANLSDSELEETILAELRGKSEKEAFTRLKLGEAWNKRLSPSLLNVWAKYTKKLKEPEMLSEDEVNARMLKILSDHHYETDLLEILKASRKIAATEDIASRLQIALMKKWQEKSTPVDVAFKLLGLDTDAKKLLSGPEVELFTTFLTKPGMTADETQVIKLNTFREYFGDRTVAKVLKAAERKGRVAASAV